MRTKTDEKRCAIIEAAVAVFEQVGFERASMSAIAAKVGGSKATLYNYFQSKEALFAAAVTHALAERGRLVLDLLSSSKSVVETLSDFGVWHLKFLTQPEILALQRTVMNDGFASGLGSEVYKLGPRQVLDALTAFFAKRHDAGDILVDSPELAAILFKGLLESGVAEPLLYGSDQVRDVKEAARTAAEAICKIYR